MIYVNGDIFEGAWKNDMRHGKGTLVRHGERIEGRWKNDNRNTNGQQIIIDDDGGEYNGWIVDGKRHGIGTYKFADGTIYQGQWFKDEIRGYGIMTYS